MDLPLIIVFVVLALVAGAAMGWFAGSRPVADWKARHAERDAAATELDERFKAAIRDLATASTQAERAAALDTELRELRASHVAASSDLAALKEKTANFDEQKRLLLEAQESLKREFEAAGAKVLSNAQEAFLKRAEDRFNESEKTSAERIRTLLTPVDESLKSYKKQVEELEAKRVDAFGALTGQIEAMRAGQEAVRTEAMRLGNALTNAPKARGRWGEQQLKNLLESCGLSEHTDFSLEHSIDTEEGRLRPDAIVRIPGGKVLVIDAKVSLNAYQEAFHADTEEGKKLALEAHVRSMKNHVQQLGAKSYQSQFEEAPDYVVMFVPGEHFVAAALEFDPNLWDFAFEKRVLLATPTNLVAIARTVAQVWRQDALAQEAQEIGRLATELYDRIAVAGDHLKRVGSGLETAVSNYNKFVGSYERNVMSSARKLRDKGIETGKREVEDVPLVESAPRYTASDVEGSPVPRLVDADDREDALKTG